MTRALLALPLLALASCATVQVRTIRPSHGPQRRARSVQLTFTRALP